MSAWILWVFVINGNPMAATSQAALFPTKEMCEAAAAKIKENVNGNVQTVCTETQVIK